MSESKLIITPILEQMLDIIEARKFVDPRPRYVNALIEASEILALYAVLEQHGERVRARDAEAMAEARKKAGLPPEGGQGDEELRR